MTTFYISEITVRAGKKLQELVPSLVYAKVREVLNNKAINVNLHRVTDDHRFYAAEDHTFYVLAAGADEIVAIEFPGQETIHAGNLRNALYYGQHTTAPIGTWIIDAHRFYGRMYIDIYEVYGNPYITVPLPPALPAKTGADWYEKALTRNIEAGAYPKHESGATFAQTAYQGDSIMRNGVTLYWIPALKRYARIVEDH